MELPDQITEALAVARRFAPDAATLPVRFEDDYDGFAAVSESEIIVTSRLIDECTPQEIAGAMFTMLKIGEAGRIVIDAVSEFSTPAPTMASRSVNIVAQQLVNGMIDSLDPDGVEMTVYGRRHGRHEILTPISSDEIVDTYLNLPLFMHEDMSYDEGSDDDVEYDQNVDTVGYDEQANR